MNMKAMLGAIVALVIAVGATAYLVARGATPAPPPPKPVVPELADQLETNPFDLTAPGPRSKVVVEEKHFDFGVMALGTEQSHDFVFKNEGEGPLKLAKGPIMCKCTMPAVPDQEIKPGESLNIKLTWKPITNDNDFSKEAVIWTNDPASPKINLSIKGHVYSDPVVYPTQFALGDIPWDKETESQVRLASPITADLKIEGVEVSNPDWLSVTWKQATAEELAAAGVYPRPLSGYSVDLKILPNTTVGPFTGWIKLKTNRTPSEQKIDVIGSRTGPIAIHGEHYQAGMTLIDLKKFKSEDGKAIKMFMFMAPFGEDLKALEVTSKSNHLTASITKAPLSDSSKDRYVLLVEAAKGITPGTNYTVEVPDELVIKLNHPNVPEMKFIVRYKVQ